MYSNSMREKYSVRSSAPPSPSSFLLARKTDLRQVHWQLVSHRNSSPCQQFRSRQRNPAIFLFKAPDQTCDRQIATNCALLRKRGDRPYISNLQENALKLKHTVEHSNRIAIIKIISSLYIIRCYLVSIRGSGQF